MTIEIYTINLKRSSHRRKYMTSKLSDIDVPKSFIEALDGLDKCPYGFERYDRNTLKKVGKDLRATEVACFLSHMKAIKTAKDKDLDWVIILEDDVLISPKFKQFTQLLKAGSYKSPDCIRLYNRGSSMHKCGENISLKQRKTFKNWGGARGYALSRGGIDKVLKTYDSINLKVDNYLFGHWHTGLQIYDTNKNLVDIKQDIKSDIGYCSSSKPAYKTLNRIYYKINYALKCRFKCLR